MNIPTPTELDAAAETAEEQRERDAHLAEAMTALLTALPNLGIARVEAEITNTQDKPRIGDITAFTESGDIRDLTATEPTTFGWGEDHQTYDNLRAFVADYLSAVLLHQREKHLTNGTLTFRVASGVVVQPIDYAARDAELTKVRAEQLQADKKQLITLLKSHGVVRAEAEYDGEGDEGQINEINAFKADDTTVDLSKTGPLSFGEGQDLRSYTSLHEFADELAWEVLTAYHDGFEINDGGFGTIVIDVMEGVIRLEHQDRIMSTAYTETEI